MARGLLILSDLSIIIALIFLSAIYSQPLEDFYVIYIITDSERSDFNTDLSSSSDGSQLTLGKDANKISQY